MLRALHIRDYALIEELEVSFGPGLNIVTGETGAGKSIIIGALQMILGARASSDSVRAGARRAVIEGVFDEVEGLSKVLSGNAIEVQKHLTLRREITESQSRAFINDTPATVGLLRTIADDLIDLHGQHEHQSLLRVETHVELLDEFGGLGRLAGSYRTHFNTMSRLTTDLEALQDKEHELRQRYELHAFQAKEIDDIAPVAGEDDDLEKELVFLDNAERLRTVTATLADVLYAADDSIHDRFDRALRELEDVANLDPRLQDTLKDLRSAMISIDEGAKTLQDYSAGVDIDSERLEVVRERIGAIEQLKRKYGGSLEAVLAYRDELKAEIQGEEDFDARKERVQAEIQSEMRSISKVALELARRRREAADRVEKGVIGELKDLGIGRARFEVRFDRREDPDGWVLAEDGETRLDALPNGVESVEFFLSANVGEEPRPLARIASGGEISRIMLATKSILAKREPFPILVFDEIDVGISGNIATRVGRKLQRLAEDHQIICITHLPQIAAVGNHHYQVEKVVEDARAKTRIRRLSEEERLSEIASLISGDASSEHALRSAEELVAGSRSEG